MTMTTYRAIAMRIGLATLALGMGLAACDDDRIETNPRAERPPHAERPMPRQHAEAATPPSADRPPNLAPGAAPGARDRTAPDIVGTWTVLVGASDIRNEDLAAGTTYRFEEGGKVTVAGAKQCAYLIEAKTLFVDCGGAPVKGAVDFPDGETILWTLGDSGRLTLKKR